MAAGRTVRVGRTVGGERKRLDSSKITFGELVALASGLVLLIALFLNWFEAASAWQALNVVDFLLALMALVAMGVALSGAAGVELGLPRVSIAALGAVALVIVLTFLLEADARGFGLFLAVLAAGGLTYGGYTASRDKGRPAGSATGARERPAPVTRPRPGAPPAAPSRPRPRPETAAGARRSAGNPPPPPPPSG